jgi:hypothetical protein
MPASLQKVVTGGLLMMLVRFPSLSMVYCVYSQQWEMLTMVTKLDPLMVVVACRMSHADSWCDGRTPLDGLLAPRLD